MTESEDIFEMWMERNEIKYIENITHICICHNKPLQKVDCGLCGEVNYIPVDKKCSYCHEELCQK